MSVDYSAGTPAPAGKNQGSLLEQFVTLAEHLAMGQGGTITNSNTSTQTVDFLGKSFTVTEDVSEKITVTPV